VSLNARGMVLIPAIVVSHPVYKIIVNIFLNAPDNFIFPGRIFS